MDDQNEGGTTVAMSFFAAALFIIGSHFAVGEIVGLIDSARPGARFDVVTLTACQLLVHLGLVFVIARIYARETSMRTILGLRPVGALTLLLAFIAGVAADMPVSLLERLWSQRFPLSDEEKAFVERMLQADTTSAKIALGLCLAIVWPISQELFHRGAIFGRLRVKHDARTAMYALAAFYALSSVTSPRNLPSAAILGLGLASLRAASGSTWAPIAAHLGYMGSAIARHFRGPPDEALTAKHALVGAAIALACALFLAARLGREPIALAARRADGY